MDAVAAWWAFAFILLILAIVAGTWLLIRAHRSDRRRAAHLAPRFVKYTGADQ